MHVVFEYQFWISGWFGFTWRMKLSQAIDYDYESKEREIELVYVYQKL